MREATASSMFRTSKMFGTSNPILMVSTSRKRSFPLLFTTFLFLGVVAVVIFITVIFGKVSGEEFNPDTFQRRRFSFYEIPMIHLQVWPIQRVPHSSQMLTHVQSVLSQSKVASTQTNRWDLVEMQRNDQIQFADANILQLYLMAENGQGKYFWQEWGTQHKQLELALWEEVAYLSRQNLYLLVPSVFELAQSCDGNLSDFRRRLATHLYQDLLKMGLACLESTQPDSAELLLSAALHYQPESTAALRARAQAFDELGQPEKAASDRQKLQQSPADPPS